MTIPPTLHPIPFDATVRPSVLPGPAAATGTRRLLACTCMLAMSATVSAAGAPFVLPAQYKAEMTPMEGFFKPSVVLFHGGEGKVRVEATIMGCTGATIVREDLKKVFRLTQEGTTWELSEETPLDQAKKNGDGIFIDQADAVWTREGTETIRTIVCDKWLVTTPDGKRGTYWFKPDHTPVRYQRGKAAMEVTSFTAGPQDAALFEPPATR